MNGQMPAQTSSHMNMQMPTQMYVQVPTQMTAQHSAQMPTQVPIQMPAQMTGQMAGQMSGQFFLYPAPVGGYPLMSTPPPTQGAVPSGTTSIPVNFMSTLPVQCSSGATAASTSSPLYEAVPA